MGISASQARLLTITARLTSNEYESQQISNAKMRLATQSEQASSNYIAALASKQLMFTTYDAKGAAVTENLTANALYQYSDMKNQYALVNSSGQLLISQADAANFKKSANLSEFLSAYGLEKEYKSPTLKANAEKLEKQEFKDYYSKWEEAVKDVSSRNFGTEDNPITAEEAFQTQKYEAYRSYQAALATYNEKLDLYNSGMTDINLDIYMEALSSAKAAYTDTITYDKWAQSQAAYQTTINDDGSVSKTETEVYKNVQKYFEVLEEMTAEAEDLGCTNLEDMYTYSDATKAQWYTNLWYRLNGESTDKSSKGANGTNYSVLDSKLASSRQWIQEALTQGAVTLESASYKKTTNAIPDENNPLSANLRGISWKSVIYSSCSDFTELDDDSAIAKAEAEYQKTNNEITAKDQKYENKIKTLDTEHTSLQTEYESVKSAMNKNIERSFKAFS